MIEDATTPRVAGLTRLSDSTGSAQAWAVLVTALVAGGSALAVLRGLLPVAQSTLNGLVSGSYLASGAVGLALVYGIVRLVNFAHGDIITLGAYVGFLVNVVWGLPLVAAGVAAIAVTALFGIALEVLLWRPMRAKKAGLFQLLIMTMGLALLVRNSIQLVAGARGRALDVNVIASLHFGGLRIGRTQLIAALVAFAMLLLVAFILRATRLGKQMRAISDDFALAETAGIDTQRVAIVTWGIGAGVAGLTGVLFSTTVGVMTPGLGFSLLLSLFAATVLGGIGNAYGALVGGLTIGLVQEWSTLLIGSRWKLVVGFVILITVLIVRPQGLLGRRVG